MNKKVVIGGVAGAAVIATAATGAVLTAIYQIGDEDRAKIEDMVSVVEGLARGTECFVLQAGYSSFSDVQFNEYVEKCQKRITAAEKIDYITVNNPEVNPLLVEINEDIDGLIPRMKEALVCYKRERGGQGDCDNEESAALYSVYGQVNRKIEKLKEAL